jgi:hypothetical protein
MSEAKRLPQDPEVSDSPATATSYIRALDADEGMLPVFDDVPLEPLAFVDAFFDDWVMRHFAVSVKLHDVHRLSEHDPERLAVLDDLSVVQGVLLELHDFASTEPRLRALMENSREIQNGVTALYGWLDELLDAAAARGVAQLRPGFADTGEEAFPAILRTLESVHPDLEILLHAEQLEVEEDIAHKIALCFRQIGAVVVRVSGRVGSSLPPALLR